MLRWRVLGGVTLAGLGAVVACGAGPDGASDPTAPEGDAGIVAETGASDGRPARDAAVDVVDADAGDAADGADAEDAGDAADGADAGEPGDAGDAGDAQGPPVGPPDSFPAGDYDVETVLDTTNDRRPISPLIYGVNSSNVASLPADLLASVTFVRRGGDRVNTLTNPLRS